VAVPGRALCAAADYEKGVAFLKAGNPAEALELLEPLKASDGTNPYLFYHLGLAYYMLDRFKESFESFEEAARLSGNGDAGELGLDAAFFSLGAAMYKSGDFRGAKDSLNKGLAYSPGDGEGLYYMGLTLAELGEYEKASEKLDAAARAFGSDEASLSAVRNARGILRHKMGDNKGAISEFKGTLESDPLNVEALYYLGRLTYMEEGFAASRPYFDRIVNLGAGADEDTKETLFTTFFNMGVDFQDRGKSASASEMFERALSLKPGDAEARYYLGYNLMAQDRYEDAYTEFRQALDIDPSLKRAKAQMEVAGKFAAETAAGKADGLMEAGEYHAALALYEKASAFEPGNSRISKSLTAAKKAVEEDTKRRAGEIREMLKRGSFLEAKAASDTLSGLNPGSKLAADVREEVSSAMSRARAEFGRKAAEAEKAGRLKEAAGYYSALLEIDPADRTATAGLERTSGRINEARRAAKSAMESGLYLEAIKAYERLVGYVPGDPDASVGLEEAKRRLRQDLALALKNAEDSFGKEDFTMAAHHASRALELDPGNAQALELRAKIGDRSRELVLRYVREGDGYLDEGMLDKATKSYEAALLLDPGNDSAKNGLKRASSSPVSSEVEEQVRKVYLKGVEHYTGGEFELAIEAWREVLKLDPSNEKAASGIKRAEEKLRQTSR